MFTSSVRMRSMGRAHQYTWEITEHDRPNRMTVESTSGPFPTALASQFSPEDGATRVHASVIGRPTGLQRVLQPMIASTTQKNIDRGYARLKRLLEAGTAA